MGRAREDGRKHMGKSGRTNLQSQPRRLEDPELDRAMRRIRLADKFRLVFLFLSLLMLLYVFYGDKFAGEAAWFEGSRQVIYNILFYVVAAMLLMTLLKIFLVSRYNALVKKKRKQG